MSTARNRYATVCLTLLLLVTTGCNVLPGIPRPPTLTSTLAAPTPAASATPTPSMLSADEWIAFAKDNNVWLIHANGSDLKQITSNPPSAQGTSSDGKFVIKWSPDGRMLAFSRGTGIYIVELETGTATLLVNDSGGGFDWSPNAKQIIYDAAVNPRPDTLGPRNTGLWVIGVEGGDPGLIVPSTAEFAAVFEPLWSPDGSHVLVSRGSGNVELTELGSGTFEALVPGGDYLGGSCYWSPVGSTIACRQRHEDSGKPAAVRFYDENGRLIREIHLPTELRFATLGPWSPDGRHLSLAGSSGSADPYNLQQTVAVLAVESGEFRLLEPGRPTSWSPDGQWIVADFPAGPNGLNRPSMQVINTISRQSYPLADGVDPVWQPSRAASTSVPAAAATSWTGTPRAPALCSFAEIEVRHTDKGDYLQMCTHGAPWEVGPLESGAALVGPNGKFFVYCSNSGNCFAGRMGEAHLTPIGSVKYFSIIHRNGVPDYQFDFVGEHPYTVRVRELAFGQKEIFTIPYRITDPN